MCVCVCVCVCVCTPLSTLIFLIFPFRFSLQGMATVIPLPLISLYTGRELEAMVCGQTDIDLELLRSVTQYRTGLLPDSELVKWFWEIMQEISRVGE